MDQFIKEGEGVPDMILLHEINENAVFENLKTRLHRGQYTYIGNVVVSVNPFKALEHYGPHTIPKYKNRYLHENPPHIYALAEETFVSMTRDRADQCVIISGESGAGKTEASKILMTYIAAVSGGRDKAEKIKEDLLASNPILESFGNAKTLRNDNSSRFGKYMQIFFNYSGVPDGGQILNYLLEKSRVTQREQGERSYHIFYMLLTDREMCAKLKLDGTADSYRYLSQSNCVKVDKVDDSMEFKQVKRALSTMGFADAKVLNMMRIVAAVLHLGQLEFASKGQESVISNVPVLQRICELIGVQPNALGKALTYRSINAGGAQASKIGVPLDPKQASDARDALARSLYERLFQWLVTQLNQVLKPHGTEDKLSIGVLDIYGFEIFGKNGFNQFVINLTNEKLQQVFIELTLKQEQEEYMREGIQWTPVDYFNNKVICELIEKKPMGIIAILDECTLLSNTTDAQFLQKLSHNFGKNPHYEDYESSKNKEIKHSEFRVKHYAGDVTYDVDGMLETNRDTLFPDLINACAEGKNPIMPAIFQRYDSKKRPTTSGSQFRTALNALIDNLMSCEPHYIRCIKPNENKQALACDDTRLKHQIRYLGLVENVRVRRAGFAFRMTYEHFFRRYRLVAQSTYPRWSGSDRDGCAELMRALQVPAQGGFQMGKTKLFLKEPTTLFAFEDARNAQLPAIVTRMQALYRGWRERAKWRQRKAAVQLQLVWRTFKSRHWARELASVFANVGSEQGVWGARTQWPQAPTVLTSAQRAAEKVHATWQCNQRYNALSEDERDQLRKKAIAYAFFGQQKSWDFARYYQCTYLEQASNPRSQAYIAAMSKLFSAGGDNSVSFSDLCGKVNPKGKTQPRAITVTDRNVYHQDPKNYVTKKVPMNLGEITGIYLSTLSDRFVIIRCKPPVRDLVLDCGLSGEERASELVAVLANGIHRLTGQWPPIAFADRATFNNTRNEAKQTPDITVTFQKDPRAKVAKYKGGAAPLIICPP